MSEQDRASINLRQNKTNQVISEIKQKDSVITNRVDSIIRYLNTKIAPSLKVFKVSGDGGNLTEVDGTVRFAFGENEIENLEGNIVKYANRVFTIPVGSADESAGLYMRVDPDGQQQGLYIEITDSQTGNFGGGIKLVHYGQEDAAYIALFKDGGVALESASYADGTRGFISTLQHNREDDNYQFPYSTLYQSVWGFDGTGGAKCAPLYGVFYAALSLGRSFSIRLQDESADGFSWGTPEFLIRSYNLATTYFKVTNNGDMYYMGRQFLNGTVQDMSPEEDVSATIDNTSSITEYTINGSNPLSIQDGIEQGQKKEIYTIAVTTAGSGRLTGTNIVGSDITFSAVGHSVILRWSASQSKWYLSGAPNGAIWTP